MPSHATSSRAAFCRSSLTKPDFYLSRWSNNSKIGYPYLPAHDPGGGVPAAGGPARVACQPLAPAFVRHLPARVICQPAPGVRGSLLPGSLAGPGCQALPGHSPARVVRRARPASTALPAAWPCQGRPPGSATSDRCLPGSCGVDGQAFARVARNCPRFASANQSASPATSDHVLPPGCAPCFCQCPARGQPRQGRPSCFFGHAPCFCQPCATCTLRGSPASFAGQAFGPPGSFVAGWRAWHPGRRPGGDWQGGRWQKHEAVLIGSSQRKVWG